MTLETQWLALVTMFASGLLLGILLDLYRVLKGQWQLTGWVVALVDLCYWILAAGWIFSVLLWSTWGELRFYMLIVLFTGGIVYYLWLSHPIIKVILLAIRVVQALIRILINLLRLFVWIPLMYIVLFGKQVLWFILRAFLAVLRAVAWLLRPVWRPLEPVYRPIYDCFLKVFRFAAGIWRKMKNVLLRKG